MIYGIILGLAVIVGSVFQMFWWGLVAGLALDLVLFLFYKYGTFLKGLVPWRKKTGTPTPPAGAPAAPAPAAAAAKASGSGSGWKWFRRGVILAILAWCAYSIDQDVGFPGTWIAKKAYSETVDLVIENRQDQKLCGLHFPEGRKIKFSFPYPDNSLGEIRATVQNGDRSYDADLAAGMRIEGTPRHRAFRPNGQCLKVTWPSAGEDKERGFIPGKGHGKGITITILFEAA